MNPSRARGSGMGAGFALRSVTVHPAPVSHGKSPPRPLER
ncbi:hypothetical protein SFR_3279 [Streptomyces sp. FR-008]|nr:hypothetical protein SFR_3279 [Streptomyces sp. FR-008]